MDWPDGQREGNLRLALAGILRLMELEGMPALEDAKVAVEARHATRQRRLAGPDYSNEPGTPPGSGRRIR